MVNEFFFEDRSAMQQVLLAFCVSHLQQALTANDTATLLVSGGSSPEPVYRQLSLADLAWDRISVALVDERWVDRDQANSNAAFIARTLLQNKAAAATFVGMKNTAASASLGQAACNQTYLQLPKPWSLCLLGMGNDGHTASLFPFAKGLSEALDLSDSQSVCSAIEAKKSEVTGEITERMSLSLSGLLQAERLLLIITGEEKRLVYEQAMSGDDIEEMPVRAVLKQRQLPIDVYWAP